jgi:hypothetical protein
MQAGTRLRRSAKALQPELRKFVSAYGLTYRSQSLSVTYICAGPTRNKRQRDMWDRIWDCGGEVVRVIGFLPREQWLIVLVGVLIVGLFCMRGHVLK